jgi:hypothetical protein
MVSLHALQNIRLTYRVEQSTSSAPLEGRFKTFISTAVIEIKERRTVLQEDNNAFSFPFNGSTKIIIGHGAWMTLFFSSGIDNIWKRLSESRISPTFSMAKSPSDIS